MNDLPNDSHAAMLALSADASRVLELGSGPGVMTREFRGRNQHVTAVEVDPTLAAAAAEYADASHVADLDVDDIVEIVGGERFDVVVMGDVLEHLRAPDRLLQRLPAVLADGGAIVASVPNVAHGDVRLMLAAGEWTYRDLGLMDATHVHFFTRETLVAALTDAGFGIEVLHRTVKPLLDTELEIDAATVPDELIDWIGAQDEVETYQFLVRATPGSAHQVDVGPQPGRGVDTAEGSVTSRMREEIISLRQRTEFLDEAAERGAWAEAELRAMRARKSVRIIERLQSLASRRR